MQSLTKVDLYLFLSAQMVEQMIPILQSLRFESSFTLDGRADDTDIAKPEV